MCPDIDFGDWLKQFLETESKETLSMMFSIIYVLWVARNAKVHDNKDVDIYDLVERSLTTYNKFMQTRKTKNNNHQQQNHNIQIRTTSQARWCPPLANYYKINCDANLKIDGFWGLSAVARDKHGEIVAAATWRERGEQIIVEAEAKTMLNATNFASDCCLCRVIIKSDCEVKVKRVNATN